MTKPADTEKKVDALEQTLVEAWHRQSRPGLDPGWSDGVMDRIRTTAHDGPEATATSSPTGIPEPPSEPDAPGSPDEAALRTGSEGAAPRAPDARPGAPHPAGERLGDDPGNKTVVSSLLLGFGLLAVGLVLTLSAASSRAPLAGNRPPSPSGVPLHDAGVREAARLVALQIGLSPDEERRLADALASETAGAPAEARGTAAPLRKALLDLRPELSEAKRHALEVYLATLR